MAKILVLTVPAFLLGITACSSPKVHPAPTAEQAASAAVVAPVAVAEVAPKAVEPVVPQAGAEPATIAKPVEASPQRVAQTASETKPIAPAAKAAVVKTETHAAQAAGSGVLSKEQALALAAKGNCLVCHKIEIKVVGPAWKDVGAKYKGDANAVGTIATHIKKGGSFGWKLGAMPPRGGSMLSDADVDSLARFIASLK